MLWGYTPDINTQCACQKDKELNTCLLQTRSHPLQASFWLLEAGNTIFGKREGPLRIDSVYSESCFLQHRFWLVLEAPPSIRTVNQSLQRRAGCFPNQERNNKGDESKAQWVGGGQVEDCSVPCPRLWFPHTRLSLRAPGGQGQASRGGISASVQHTVHST